MYVLTDTIGDSAGRSVTLAYASDVTTVLRGWYPEAPVEIFDAIAELQTALNNGEPTDAYETYLGITVEHAPDHKPFTALVEVTGDGGQSWSPGITVTGEAELVEAKATVYAATATQAAQFVAANVHPNTGPGESWRIRVWPGDDADTSPAPAAICYPDEVAAPDEVSE